MAGMAAIPGLLVLGLLVAFLWSNLKPKPPDPRREAFPARMALLRLDRHLIAATRVVHVDIRDGMSHGGAGDKTISETTQTRFESEVEATGLTFFLLAEVRVEEEEGEEEEEEEVEES